MSTQSGQGIGDYDNTPLQIAREVVERAACLDAEVEAYVEMSRTVTVKVFGGQVESVTVAEPRGVGIRAVKGGRTGYASTTVVDAEGIDSAVDGLKAHLQSADEDPYAGLPTPTGDSPTPVDGLWSPGVVEMSLEQKTDLALQTEAAALGLTGVEAVEEAVYSDEESRVAVVSSLGVEAEGRKSHGFVYAVAQAASKGEKQTGLGYSMARDPGELDAGAAGREAATKALALLGGKQCPRGTYDVVLDEAVAAALIASIAEALSAEAVQKGRSVFAGRLGETVAPAGFTLTDDGLHPQGIATSPFDGEGVPQQRTVLVKGGVLQSYLYDSRAARREGGGARSTGNASRSSYRSLPRLGASNLVVQVGSGSVERLFSRVGSGLYVESVAGVHAGVNPVSGEISLGVSGRLIEGGELGTPVREVTIATDFAGLLKGIVDLGGKARWVPLYGSAYIAPMLVEGIAVSGE